MHGEARQGRDEHHDEARRSQQSAARGRKPILGHGELLSAESALGADPGARCVAVNVADVGAAADSLVIGAEVGPLEGADDDFGAGLFVGFGAEGLDSGDELDAGLGVDGPSVSLAGVRSHPDSVDDGPATQWSVPAPPTTIESAVA
jgi:hypothetical protein